MSYSFEFGRSVVRKYDDFCINPDIPLFMQLDTLKEDLIQVEYDSGHMLDIGWYPEFKLKGCFKICVIKSDEIIYEKSTRSIRKLRLLTEEAVRIIADSNMLK